MRSAWCRRGLWACLAIVLAMVGCANDQKTVNRVQPNALAKKMFDGEWYTKGTVIDTQIDAPIFVGSETPFDRIEWEIQEKFLIAKRAYTAVQGAESSGVIDERQTTSAVAVFAISSHFDIRREYNPATGERNNVIEENTVDRPWYEREYMRVDWSQNLLDDASMPTVYSSVPIPVKGVALFAQDTGEAEKSELAPHFEQDDDGQVVYFDLVNRYWADPAALAYDANGDGVADSAIPACYLTINSQMDCLPGAIAIRHSFARVEDRDYQARPYTQDRMERFGYFLTKRDHYDPDYGATVSERDVYAVRHNLWLASHLRDDAGKLVGCHADADCGGGGSECDLAWGRTHETEGACTIPYLERELRPIRYYVTSNLPESLLPTALAVGVEWNRAFSETVASLLRLECERAEQSDCSGYTPAKIQKERGPVFAVCRNPVTKDDAAGCGEPGFSPRFGDVRYNIVSWVSDAHSKYAGAPLGLGPASADPLTGEVISGVANLYGDGFDQLAAQARDILAMMQGDLAETDTQSSAAFAGWLAELERDRVGQASAREADRHVIQLDGHDAAEANADMDFSWSTSRLPVSTQPATLSEIRGQAAKQWQRIGAMHEGLNIARQGQGKLRGLSGSWLEDRVLNDEYASSLGLAPGSALGAAQRAQVSPFSTGGAFGAQGLSQVREQLLRSGDDAKTCLVEAADFVDEGLLGLLREIDRAVNEGDGTVTWYGTKYHVGKRGAVDYELVKEMVKQPIFFGLMAHELGHTLGLRHNFSGSYDALNYRSDYWKLRDDGTIRSRADDPMTEREIDGRLREHQYSTVMDYGHNFVVTDSHGVGHYDVAAIKMGYADIAEVFTDAPDENVAAIAGIDAQASSFMVFQVDPRTQQGDDALRALHYSSWPALVGGVANIEKRMDVRYRELGRVSSPLFGGGGYSVYKQGDKLLPVVPYLYCGDEFADSRPPCNRYDAGADPYEVMQSLIDSYWNYYPFSHFMRGRIGWDLFSVPGRSWGRYFDPLISMTHIYALYRQFFEPQLGSAFFEASEGFKYYTLGVRASYDLFRRVISTPEPESSLAYEELVDGSSMLSSDGERLPIEPKGVDAYNGRFLRSYYELGPSSEWFYFTSSGWFSEKVLALQALVSADTGYLGTDTSPDVREYSSSYYTIFPESMSAFLRAIFANDFKAYAPRLADGTLHYPDPTQLLPGNAGPAGDLVSPNLGFTLQYNAMAYGTMLVPNNFDQDFVNRARVFVAGSSEGVDLSSSVSYVDGRSGLTYYAASYPVERNGQSVEAGTGASMINFAKALEARVDEAAAANDAATQARYQAQLDDFIDNLDVLRYLTYYLGHGSDGEFLNGP